MQAAWKYVLEVAVVVMVNLCVVAFAGAWFGTVGFNPYRKPSGGVSPGPVALQVRWDGGGFAPAGELEGG